MRPRKSQRLTQQSQSLSPPLKKKQKMMTAMVGAVTLVLQHCFELVWALEIQRFLPHRLNLPF